MKTPRQLAFHLAATAILAAACNLNMAQAASVSYFGLGKVERHRQSGEASVGLESEDPYALRVFAVPTLPDTMAMMNVPGRMFPVFLSGEDALTGEELFPTPSALESAFPTGPYALTVISTSGFEEGPINLANGAFPNTPQIANYAAAQAVDRTQSFVVNWNVFEGSANGDFILFQLLNDDDDVVFETGWPGQAGSLDRSARSVTIPADRLASRNNVGVLSFMKVLEQKTGAFGGATGVTFAGKETRFPLVTGGGGTVEPTEPLLVSSSPAILASNVTTNSPVVFTFSKPMAPTQGIFWNAKGKELDETAFTYKWSGDGLTLTCTYVGGFPANTMIIWELDTSAFLDLEGNELGGDRNGGFFTTGSGSGGQTDPNDPCDPTPGDDGLGAFTVFKSINYIQTSAAPPVLDSEASLSFFASVSSPETNPVTQATLTLPGGTTRELEPLAGFFALMADFNTREALEAAYPPGTYRVQIRRNSGATVTLSVNLPASAEPPTPQLSDFNSLENFNAAADFTLAWHAFAGAGPNDQLSVALYDKMGTRFNAPDPCVPRPLEVTDTSIIVPKNTFSGTGLLDGTLTFIKFGTFDTNSVRDIYAMGAFNKQTSFKLGKASDSQVKLQNCVREANGTFRFQVAAPAGATLMVESSTDLVTWTLVSTGLASGGVFEVVDAAAANQARRYYRARTLF